MSVIMLFIFVAVVFMIINEILNSLQKNSMKKIDYLLNKIRKENPIIKSALEGDEKSIKLIEKAISNVKNKNKNRKK